MNQMVSTYYANYKTPLFATALLVLTLLQGSSFTLSLAFRGPLASDTFVTLITMVWLVMYALAAVGLIASFGLNWLTWTVRYRLLLTCLLAGTAFSVAWSVDAALTAERSIHLIGTTIVALYLGLSLPLSRLLRTSALVLGFIMVASIAVSILTPELGLQDYQGRQVWTGVLASKNTLGFWAATTLLLTTSLCFWRISTAQRLVYAGIALVSMVCLYYSVSATSLLALITASLVMLYMHAAFSLRFNIFAMMLLGILVVGLVGVAFVFIDTAELIGRSGDLTGRGEVWSQTWQLILNRPLTGYGYGTLWFPTPESLKIQQSLTDFTWTVFHAHNGLLQIASELGLPLTALALLMILQQLIEIVYCQYQRQQPGVLFVLGFVVALLVSNYSEARLLINRELYWIFFIALPVSMLQQVSVIATRTGPNQIPGFIAVNDANKLREARQRKEHKINVKGRVRRHSKVKIVNRKETDDGSDSATDPSSNDALRRQKNRRHKKAG
ncbi:MAG: O-antigen ligase family protein [Granulosicoccus sp.]